MTAVIVERHLGAPDGREFVAQLAQEFKLARRARESRRVVARLGINAHIAGETGKDFRLEDGDLGIGHHGHPWRIERLGHGMPGPCYHEYPLDGRGTVVL
jgi:hypothetical protein